MKFKEYSFKSLLINIVDNRGKTCPTADDGIPLIATNCIKNDALYPVYEKVRYVDQETYRNWFRGHPEPGDMIFVCKGSPGRVCWVSDPVGFCIAQDMVAIRADETKIYPKYLFALLRSEQTQQKILNMHVGTLIPHFKKGDFGNLYFDIPEDMEYQKKVGDAYFEFCNKIELNRQTNQTLEQIAQAIFKSWFVDFEPTRAKIIIKLKGGDQQAQDLAAQAIICGAVTLEDLATFQLDSPPINAHLLGRIHAKFDVQGGTNAAGAGSTEAANAQTSDELGDNWLPESLAATAALFPNALVDSELDEIPEGWDASTLGQHFNVVMGQSPKGDTYNEDGEGMLFFQGRRDFGFRYPTPRVYTTAPKRLAKSGDTLISVRAPVGDRNMAEQECCLGRGVAAIRHNSGSRSFTYAFIGHVEKSLSDSGSDGTVFSSINKNELSSVPFIAPDDDLLRCYEKRIHYIDQYIEVISKEIETLNILRDTLLPKLLSGELSRNPQQMEQEAC